MLVLLSEPEGAGAGSREQCAAFVSNIRCGLGSAARHVKGAGSGRANESRLVPCAGNAAEGCWGERLRVLGKVRL